MKKIIIILAAAFLVAGCQEPKSAPKADSGVQKISVKVPTGADGVTSEQRNVADRLLMDNKPGAIKHLYVISAYSGQVIIYSTVREKVTSSGKRLTPTEITHNQWAGDNPMKIRIGGKSHHTLEVLQDDGTYGSSIPYLFWWDSAGKYHQHYVGGGQIVHISDHPIAVKNIILNMEVVD